MKSKFQREIEALQKSMNNPRIVLMCPKCGLIRTPEETDHSYDICEYCKHPTLKIEETTFVSESGRATQDEMPMLRERVYRKSLYNNSQFDETAFEQRLADEKKNHDEFQRVLASIPPSNTPKCPYCNSFYVEKITTGSRFLSTVMFGLGSSKVGKQWHCRQCESNF